MTIACPAKSEAARATSGADMRQGTHQAAQKSSRTGTRAFCTTSLNNAGSLSSGSPIGGKAALQAPHLPVSERWAAGMRFARPQFLHVRITGINIATSRFRNTGINISAILHFPVPNLPRNTAKVIAGKTAYD